MTRQENGVPSPSVNWTEQWTHSQVDYISGFLQKMVSKAEILEEITASKAEDGGITT